MISRKDATPFLRHYALSLVPLTKHPQKRQCKIEFGFLLLLLVVLALCVAAFPFPSARTTIRAAAARRVDEFVHVAVALTPSRRLADTTQPVLAHLDFLIDRVQRGCHLLLRLLVALHREEVVVVRFLRRRGGLRILLDLEEEIILLLLDQVADVAQAHPLLLANNIQIIRFVRVVEDTFLRLVAPPPHAEGLCAEVLLPDLLGCGELHQDDVGFFGRDVVLRVERARRAGLVEDAVQDFLRGRLEHIGQFTTIRENLAEVPFFFCFFFFCGVKHAEKG